MKFHSSFFRLFKLVAKQNRNVNLFQVSFVFMTTFYNLQESILIGVLLTPEFSLYHPRTRCKELSINGGEVYIAQTGNLKSYLKAEYLKDYSQDGYYE